MLECCYFMLKVFGAFPDLLYMLGGIRKKGGLGGFGELDYRCFRRFLW